MSYQSKSAAVIYAKDLLRVSKFYQEVLEFEEVHFEEDHVILESPVLQLVVLTIPELIAKEIEISDPPVRRSETPIKLVFFIPNIESLRQAVVELGGALDPGEDEWQFQGHKVCDGNDPEGNVLQFREIG